MTAQEQQKKKAALEAVKQVKEGMVVGLGTGSTAKYAIEAIGQMVASGFEVTGIPTSQASDQMARSAGIKLVTFQEVPAIDLTIDGADAFDKELNVVKGGGGALFREKIVAYNSKRVVLITDSSKQVEVLGDFPLPVEVLPFALEPIKRELTSLGLQPSVRTTSSGETYYTDQHNVILDCHTGPIPDCYRLAGQLMPIPGIVCHGLFLGLVDEIITATAQGVQSLKRAID